MADPQSLSDKLDELIGSATKDCSLDFPIQTDVLANVAFKWASAALRASLAQERIQYIIGKKLRRRPSPEEQPLIPGLLDRYAETEGGYVHMSQLPRAEILHRRNRLQQSVRTALLRIAAYDELLSEPNLSERGIA